MTMGPLEFSALKFEVRTLNSWIMSVFGFTGVAQLQPGSETWAPSAVMSMLFTPVPLATNAPFSGLWLPPSPLPLMPMTWPLKSVPVLRPSPALRWAKPGRILMNSAAFAPTMV